MAIDPKCVKCGDELNDNGGILLGPPQPNEGPKEHWPVPKYHVCKECYKWAYNFIFNLPSYYEIDKPCPICNEPLDDEYDWEDRSISPICRNEKCLQKKWISRE